MTKIARRDLYDLVWTVPAKELAARFGMSEPTFKKRCAGAAVPYPQGHHWSRVRAGKVTIQPALPARAPGMHDPVDLSGSRYHHGWSEEDLTGPLPAEPVFDEPLDDIRKAMRGRLGKVSVPADLTSSVHHAIKKRLLEDDERRASWRRKGADRHWDAPYFDTLFEQRRLRVLNAFLLACGRLEIKVTVGGKKARDLTVTIHDQYLHVGLDSEADLKNGHHDYGYNKTPDGTPLVLGIRRHAGASDCVATWHDKERKLEGRIGEIVIELVVQAEANYRAGCEHRHAWLIKARHDRVERIRLARETAEQEERERLEALKQARIARLLAEAEAFRKAQAIRDYVASAHRVGVARASEEDMASWTQWALAIADTIDPVATGSTLESITDLG